jgi:uncharacterized protein (DUF2236 family)
VPIPTGGVVDRARERIVSAATAPFLHAPYPLQATLEHDGDPGLLGPDSVSWRLFGDVASIVGGIRGLLIQAAHPEVVAGVGDHSRYREDPLGRLSRTSAYVTATTYGAFPEVERAVSIVRRIHRGVEGVSSRGVPYSAADPAFSAWVHNALTDSFLVAHQTFGGSKLDQADADRFVLEQREVGSLLGASPMPGTAQALHEWVRSHPDLDTSPEMVDAIEFLTDPPLDRPLKYGYRVLMEAAVATIPDGLRSILGLTVRPGAKRVGQAAVSGLRWAMGYSPSWEVALIRVGAEVPEGLFHRPHPARSG